MIFQYQRHILTWMLCAFLGNYFYLPQAKAELVLSKPGERVTLSPAFNLPELKGIKVHSDSPLKLEFILDRGDMAPGSSKELEGVSLKQESTKLIKYFLSTLTIPEKDLWVNLSPYEKNRIVPDSFGQTEMGRDLLAQDYLLKQLTSSLMYPEAEIGKRFWKRIYEEAAKKFGSTETSVNTFNKVWIVPDKAVVYENAKTNTAYVVESALKVMMEEDYVALPKKRNTIASQIMREIIIPELQREVNTGKNFAQLRQVYNSLILAHWYKKKIKNSILSQAYVNKNKIQGIGDVSRGNIEVIYKQYLKAFKKGAYNLIKEEQDPISKQMIPRKYFSGGFSVFGLDAAMSINSNKKAITDIAQTNKAVVSVDLAMSHDETDELEQEILGLLGLQEKDLFVTKARAENKTITIKWFKNLIEDQVKYLRVGQFIIINKADADKLPRSFQSSPLLIIRNLPQGPAFDLDMDFDTSHRIVSWGGYTMGVLASMILQADKIKDSTFIDFGAGFSGILAVAAIRLGAKKVILIDGNKVNLDSIKLNIQANLNSADQGKIEYYAEDYTAFKRTHSKIYSKLENIVFVINMGGYASTFFLQTYRELYGKIKAAFISGGPEQQADFIENMVPIVLDKVKPEAVVVNPDNHNGLGVYTSYTFIPRASGNMDEAQMTDEEHEALKSVLSVSNKDQAMLGDDPASKEADEDLASEALNLILNNFSAFDDITFDVIIYPRTKQYIINFKEIKTGLLLAKVVMDRVGQSIKEFHIYQKDISKMTDQREIAAISDFKKTTYSLLLFSLLQWIKNIFPTLDEFSTTFREGNKEGAIKFFDRTLETYFKTNDGLDGIRQINQNSYLIHLSKLVVKEQDLAQLSKNGGIDLTTPAIDKAITVNTQRNFTFNIDPAQLKALEQSDGLYPTHIRIQPLYDLPQFLGVNNP